MPLKTRSYSTYRSKPSNNSNNSFLAPQARSSSTRLCRRISAARISSSMSITRVVRARGMTVRAIRLRCGRFLPPGSPTNKIKCPGASKLPMRLTLHSQSSMRTWSNSSWKCTPVRASLILLKNWIISWYLRSCQYTITYTAIRPLTPLKSINSSLRSWCVRRRPWINPT